MDKKDEIILQQLDVIRSMTERNLRSVNSDFWGTPLSPAEKPGEKAAPKTPDKAPEKKSGGPEQPSEAPEPLPKEDMKDLLAELDGYIGLQTVKEEVHNLINMASVYQLRRQHDLPTTDMSLHLVFTGNPGTGKTMMARMMARIYRSLDILSRGQLVEVDRSGLVAGYVGQTAIKTQKVIEKAMGGVLFIDEAYALNGRSENDFGQEAIDTILKAMEDHRDDFVVIVAGYASLMPRFIDSNPGLKSRFNKYLFFEDYNGAQLYDIFLARVKSNDYRLDDGAAQAIREHLEELYEDRDENFGNARDVRNVFERAVARQSDRVAALENPDKEALMALTLSDLREDEDEEPESAPASAGPAAPAE